jgi:hypothetical protein
MRATHAGSSPVADTPAPRFARVPTSTVKPRITWHIQQLEVPAMPLDFMPRNDLERRLFAAQRGQIPPEAFAEALVGSKVFMPVCENLTSEGPQTLQAAEPLKLLDENGDEILVLFTSPERAKEFLQDYPDYRGGLLTELARILERLGLGYTISLNPGDPLGLDFKAGDVARIAAQRGRSARTH